MESVDWSHLFRHRRNINRRYKSIWSLPIAPRYSDVLFSETKNPGSLLEIGAGDRGLKKKISKIWPDCSYFSFDIDRNINHDFYQLEDISGNYDLICMFEVIEHVPPDIALCILKKCYEVIKPGKKMMITTPNIYYPPGYLRDATHVTPWCYDELGGIVSMAGFEIDKLFRLYKESFFEQLFRRYFFYPLFRLMRIDFAKQIMIIATKPEEK